VEGVCVVHQGCFLSGLDGVIVKGSNLGMMSHHSYLSCDLQILGEKTPFIPTRPCSESYVPHPEKKGLRRRRSLCQNHHSDLFTQLIYTLTLWKMRKGLWVAAWLTVNLVQKNTINSWLPWWCQDLLVSFQTLKHKRVKLQK